MLTFFVYSGFSQTVQPVVEPIMVKEKHSPKKATILSAVLPGAGQIYNKKYWKPPVIYGAMGALVYFAIDNNENHVYYFSELSYRAKNPGFTNNPELELLNETALTEQSDYHKRWRNNLFVFTGLVYILNIVDANVDAHFFSFDVSDDLTLKVEPYTDLNYSQKMVNGFSLKLKFK